MNMKNTEPTPSSVDHSGDEYTDARQKTRQENIVYINGKPVDVRKYGKDPFAGEKHVRKKKKKSGISIAVMVILIIAAVNIVPGLIALLSSRRNAGSFPEESHTVHMGSSDSESSVPDAVYPNTKISTDDWYHFAIAGELFSAGGTVNDFLNTGDLYLSKDMESELDPDREMADSGQDYCYLMQGNTRIASLKVTSPTSEEVPLRDAIVISADLDFRGNIRFGTEACCRIRPVDAFSIAASRDGNSDLTEASSGCGDPDGLAVFSRSDIEDVLKDYQSEDLNDTTTVYYMTDAADSYNAHTIAIDYYEDLAYAVTITNDDYYAARERAWQEERDRKQKEYEAQQKLIDERTEKMSALLPDGTSEDAPYKTPSSVGHSMDSCTMKLADSLYQFPLPVSVLMEDGWQFSEDSYGSGQPITADTKLEPHAYQFAYLTNREGAQIQAGISNFSSAETAALSDCAVLTIGQNLMAFDTAIVDISIPESISQETTIDDFKTYLDTLDLEQLKAQGYYDDYEYSGLSSYTISFPAKEADGGEGLASSVNIQFYDGELAVINYGVNVTWYPGAY